MNQAKADLRKKLKQARLAMSAEERQQKSQTICDKLTDVIDWPTVETLHIFEPIESLGEVNIVPFIRQLQQTYPKLHVYTSRKINDGWHIVSVAADAKVPTASFDAVLVPMLGFDDRLHRIGYGGGYYDQLLAGQPVAQKIGVCFEQGFVDELPVEQHDVPLDVIVSEETTR